MSVKIAVHQAFLDNILQKIESQQVVQKDLQNSAANETKSTAGDKHETALAMLQMEQAQVGKKMDVLQTHLLEMNNINVKKISTIISIGSLIKTKLCYFYLSTALGKINIDGNDVYAISVKSPLGNLFLGKKVKESIIFNNSTYTVLELL